MQYRLSHSLPLFLFLITSAATADSAPQWRIAKYAPICQDRDRARYEEECHRLPGGYQYVYEMTGDKRLSALKQAKKVVDARRGHDSHMRKWRSKQ